MGDAFDTGIAGNRSRHPLSRRESFGLGALGLLLSTGAAAISLANSGDEDQLLHAAAGSVTIAVLVGVGLFAWRRDPANRFGHLLVLAGFGWFLGALGASDDGFLYSVGRVSAWVLEVLLIFLFLSYPSGRLTSRLERGVVGATAVVALTLYLPTALLVDQYPVPWTFCTDQCPGNAFQVVSPEPGLVDSIVRPAREVMTIGLFLAVALLMLNRVITATPLVRRGLTPVFAALILRFAAALTFLAARRAGASDAVLEALASVYLFTVPAAALGFLIGLLRWRVHSASALQELAAAPEPVAPEQLRARLAKALGDPTLELYYRVPGVTGWRDPTGGRVELPDRGLDHCIVEVGGDGGSTAAIVCDPALNDQRSLVEAAGSWVRAALERQRLTAALNASLRDVEASRRRLAAAAASERRRIERDLHDGAQQQLVTLRVKLELAGEEIERDPQRGAEMLRDLAPRVDSVIEEVRSLARGIYPSLLADAGLGEALRAVALRGELPVELDVDSVGRYPLELESAVYFCCLEALQNAVKHSGASGVSIRLAAGAGELRFEVLDDGRGFSPEDGEAGAGLTNMRDRVAAIGGSLSVDSAPGRGTVVRGRVPTTSG